MNKPVLLSWRCAVILGAALSLPAVCAAATSVAPSESVELTNLDEPDTSAPAPQVSAATAAACTSARAAAAKAIKGKRRPVTEELVCDEASADADAVGTQADEMATNSDSEAAKRDPSLDDAPRVLGAGSGQSLNSGMYGVNGTVGSGAINTPVSSSTDTPASASGDTTVGSEPSTSAGSTAGTSAGNSGASAGGSTPPVPLTAAQMALAQYRTLMLQQAASTNYINANPAISRRYLQVDRTTYQARIGQ